MGISLRGAPRWAVGPTGKLIRLIDETDDPDAVVDADRWCFAEPPVVQRVAQGRQGQRFLGLPRHVSSPLAVTRRMVPSLSTRMASRPAIFHSPSVPSRGNVFPTSMVPSTPLAERTKTDA